MVLNVFNTAQFLQTAGYIGLFLMIYAETGLLIGLVLPGENLLFTVGLLSSLGYFNIWIVIPVTFVAAVLADSTGYGLGKKYGRGVFTKRHSLFFNQSYIEKSEKFFQKHGGKAVILGRFLPFIRTLTPIFAGIGELRYKTFLIYNIVGAFLWTVVVALSAYFLGRAIPDANHYVIWLAIGVVIIFMLPGFVGALFNKASRNKIKTFFKEHLHKY
jgi:membrane-associated protein